MKRKSCSGRKERKESLEIDKDNEESERKAGEGGTEKAGEGKAV